MRHSSSPYPWCVLALVAAGTVLQAAGSIRVVPLVRDGQVLVSCELADGFTDELRQAVHSGLRTTLTYTIELRIEVPVWVDRTIASAVVSQSVQYDNLMRRYTISRTIDGRIEESRTTDDEAVVRQWMTKFDRLPLFQTSRLALDRSYYIRARATARPRGVRFIWPWGSGPSGQATFTFIQ